MQISYMFSPVGGEAAAQARSAAERNMAGQTAGLRASLGLISDKIDFKIKAVKSDKEGHYIVIKGSIQKEDITIINIYAPNIGALQYVRQMLTK